MKMGNPMIRVALTEAAGATNGWGYTRNSDSCARDQDANRRKGIGSGETDFGLPIKAVIYGSFVPSLNKGSISWVEFFVRGERTQTVHFDKPINLQTYDLDFDANLYAGTLLMVTRTRTRSEVGLVRIICSGSEEMICSMATKATTYLMAVAATIACLEATAPINSSAEMATTTSTAPQAATC